MKKIIGFLALFVGLAAGLGYWQTTRGQSPEALEARYTTPADSFVDIDGARVRVRDEGPKDGPVIILLHGFTYSLESWDAWAHELAQDHRVIRYDLLGHGLTGPDPQKRYAPEQRAAFIGKVMDALDIDRAIIAGNSLGGLAAWRFAAHNPTRVDSLVLVAAAAFPYNGVTDEPAEIPAAMKAYLTLTPRAGVEQSIGFLWSDAEKIPAGRIDQVHDLMQRRGNGQAFIQSLEAFTLPDPTEMLQKITAPTLLMWGADDMLVSLKEQGQPIAQAIPGAELIVYDNVGHTPQEEAPAATLKDLRDFLSRQMAQTPQTPDPSSVLETTAAPETSQ